MKSHGNKSNMYTGRKLFLYVIHVDIITKSQSFNRSKNVSRFDRKDLISWKKNIKK